MLDMNADTDFIKPIKNNGYPSLCAKQICTSIYNKEGSTKHAFRSSCSMTLGFVAFFAQESDTKGSIQIPFQ